jgi:hypothetical protein
MLNRVINVAFSLLLMLAFSAVARAQAPNPAPMPTTIPKMGSHPDLSGVWVSGVADARARGFNPAPKQPVNPETDEADDAVFVHRPIPIQPWAQEKFLYNSEDPKKPYAGGRNELKPYITKCSPQGPTVNWQFGAWPFEIIQSDKRVLLIFERDHEIRQIWTDGREHPKDFGHNWFGHSIGHWEGDSLVADTIGLNDQTWFDKAGHVHSDQLHLIEKLTRVEPGRLLLNITFDDPKAFTEKWSAFRNFYLKPNWEIDEEILCEDKFLGKEIPLN